MTHSHYLSAKVRLEREVLFADESRSAGSPPIIFSYGLTDV